MEWNPPKFKVLGVWFTNNIKNCENINYSEKFEETKKLFQQWMKRCITPLGRIAILKSLILSKLIHLWILLPNPPEDFIQNLQKICYVFVWNEKQDRISRKTTQKSVMEGGLGIPNLKIFIQALKITWLRKLLYTNHKWKNIAIHNYPFLENIDNFGPSIPCCDKNAFWTDVMNGYDTIFYKIHPNTSEELLAEPICFNERILIGKKVISHKHWVTNGVYCIGHFLHGDGSFLSCEEFINKYNVIVDFVTYCGCKAAIKKYISGTGIQVQNNNAMTMNTAMKILSLVQKGSKKFYDIIIKNDERPNCCDKWEEKLNRVIHWGKCFHNMHKVQDVNLKWFQMRIMHRIIGTNVILKQMGVVTDENCSFCGNVKDNIEHIFWHCEISQRFWTDFNELINEKVFFVHKMRVSKCLVILGCDDNIVIDNIFYFILLLAKQYLYKCKMDHIAPHITVFKKKLASRYKIEEYNARLKFSYQDFSARWFSYNQLCANNP